MVGPGCLSCQTTLRMVFPIAEFVGSTPMCELRVTRPAIAKVTEECAACFTSQAWQARKTTIFWLISLHISGTPAPDLHARAVCCELIQKRGQNCLRSEIIVHAGQGDAIGQEGGGRVSNLDSHLCR